MDNDLMDRQGGPCKQTRTNVMIAYDTVQMGRRAMQALRSALDEAGDVRPTVDLRLWRLDLLADSELREMADADVRKTDMLFLAIEGGASLPPAMDSWLQELTRKEEGMRGLALLVGDDELETDGLSGRVFRDIRSTAAANHLDFITNVLPWADDTRQREAMPVRENQEKRGGPSSWNEFDRARLPRGWEIND